MVQVLYHLEVYIGPLWPTKYWNSYNHNSAVPQKQLNLFNKYLLLVTVESNNNYLIRFEMKKNTIRTAPFTTYQEEFFKSFLLIMRPKKSSCLCQKTFW